MMVRKGLRFKLGKGKINQEVFGQMVENSLHSGIKIEEIIREFDNFKKLPFPEAPEDDSLDDLYADLVEIDGYTAGIVASYINGKRIDKKLICVDDEFNKKINLIKATITDSEKELVQLKNYKNRLDILIKMIEKLYNDK